ncbi:amidohydrolase [Candidatus Bathyarchaeota archaeon]|nr:amidohydrolase [Candidatus Bathyarchaeota archaeon]MBS7630200.1 amidohydrolase [Candidatus Bathyarchaeota archaeon]
MKESAWRWIDENRDRIIEISDKIWGYAELGLMEYKSSKLLADELEKHGFKVERGVAGMPTAFVASWGEGRPMIGVMGEYDALPGLSQEPVPYKTPVIEGAPGHGCGHNIHGTSGVAGAIAIKETMERVGIKGTVKFFGTPAEENYDGKVFMVRAGLFEGVDACLSHHPSQINTARLSSSNAVNSVKFHFYGKSSHAAGSPEQGRSALDAVELMNIGVNYMREHIIEKARIHYVIEAGGGQPNVVPDYARSWFYVRAPERDQVEQIYNWVLKIAEGADLMAETTHKVEFLGGCYNLLPNKTLSEIVTANMREIGVIQYTSEEMEFARKIAETVPKEQKRDVLRKLNFPDWEKYLDVDIVQEVIDPWDEGMVMAGSTDVSDVSWKTPTMEFGTATFILGAPGHSWQATACSGMSIGHKSLIFAAKTIAGAGLDLMTKPELLSKAQEEFKQRMKNRVYKSPIPEEVNPPLEVARSAYEAALKKK